MNVLVDGVECKVEVTESEKDYLPVTVDVSFDSCSSTSLLCTGWRLNNYLVGEKIIESGFSYLTSFEVESIRTMRFQKDA